MNYFEWLLHGFAYLNVGLYLLSILLAGPALAVYLIFKLVSRTKKRLTGRCVQ